MNAYRKVKLRRPITARGICKELSSLFGIYVHKQINGIILLSINVLIGLQKKLEHISLAVDFL